MNLTELITALSGIAAGKKWQYCLPEQLDWKEPRDGCTDDPLYYFRNGYHLRLKTWTLTDELPTFRKLAPGEKWHRTDFTEDMLPDGWRPLLYGEVCYKGDELFPTSGSASWKGKWQASDGDNPFPVNLISYHWRTRRPLPELPDKWAKEKAAHAEGKRIQYRFRGSKDVEWSDWLSIRNPQWCDDPSEEYRIAPDPVMVPLGPEDVPPLSLIRKIGEAQTWHWRLVSYVTATKMVCADRSYTFEEMARTHEINRPANRDTNGNPTLWEKCEKPSHQ